MSDWIVFKQERLFRNNVNVYVDLTHQK